jgi:zinc D-Ala-D-Ala carboxypeptidase
MTTLLTPHVTLEEMLASQTAARLGIDNTPTDPVILDNLKKTAEMLEQVRTLLGSRPIIISSGYRCLAVNTAVGSSPTSAHVQGQAADFTCPGFGNPYQVCQAVAASNIQFDQLIFEFASWTHIAWATNPRRQLLTIDNSGTRYGI